MAAMCRRFFDFFFACVLGATKKTKKRFAATGCCIKKSFAGRFRWVTRSARQKKIKSNRTLRPKGRLGFEFCRFRRFRVAGREKIVASSVSCAATPRFQRFSKHAQRLGALLAALSCVRIAGGAPRATVLEANLVAPL
jgi:hypothetical protein